LLRNIYKNNNNNNKAKRKKGITIIMACAHGRQNVLLGGSRVEGIDDRAMICKSMEPSAIQANIMATSCRALTNCWANCSLEWWASRQFLSTTTMSMEESRDGSQQLEFQSVLHNMAIKNERYMREIGKLMRGKDINL